MDSVSVCEGGLEVGEGSSGHRTVQWLRDRNQPRDGLKRLLGWSRGYGMGKDGLLREAWLPAQRPAVSRKYKEGC